MNWRILLECIYSFIVGVLSSRTDGPVYFITWFIILEICVAALGYSSFLSYVLSGMFYFGGWTLGRAIFDIPEQEEDNITKLSNKMYIHKAIDDIVLKWK